MKVKVLSFYFLTLVGLGACAVTPTNHSCGDNKQYSQLAISHMQTNYSWSLSDIAQTQVQPDELCNIISVTVIHSADLQDVPSQVDGDDPESIQQAGGQSVSVVIDSKTQQVINVLRFK